MPNLSNIDTEAVHLLKTLKEVLRDRKIGYRRIAEELDVSLPTVKRMLNKPTLPLDRLFALCQIADIEPGELFEMANDDLPKHTFFSSEQDELFFEHPHFLSYFNELVDHGKSPEEIEEEYQLSSLSTSRYLSKLEKVGLIERQVGYDFRFLVFPPFGFGPDSKVLRESHAEFLKHTVEQVLSPDSEKRCYAILKPMRLRFDLYKEMVGELKAIVDKYAYLSEHSGYRDLPGREPWNLAIASGPGYGEDPALIQDI